MTVKEQEKLCEYERLLQIFLSGSTDSKAFQVQFLRTFREDPNLWTGEPYQLLEALFEEVDAYEPDPSIRDKDTIDEFQLKKTIELTMPKLAAMLHCSAD